MNKKILIVEDEIIIANLLRKLLEHEGYLIFGMVSTGEKAVEEALNNEIDMIIMDIHLAGEMNGIDAVKMIKEKKNIDVIFVTGFPDIETKNSAYSTNPSGFFIKPIDIDIFINHIKRLDDAVC